MFVQRYNQRPINARCGVFVLAWLAVVAATNAAEPPSPRLAVGGLTWQEWGLHLKSVDPKGSHAKDFLSDLIAIVESTDAPWQLRRQAGLTLGRIGKPAQAAVPKLAVLLRGEGRRDSVTAGWVTKSLALFGALAEPATKDLIIQLEDPRLADVQRQSSIEALAVIGRYHANAIPPLIRLLDHGPRGANLATESALAHWQELACEAIVVVGPSASPAVPSLMQASRSSHEGVRRKSLTALGGFGQAGEVAIPAIVDCLIHDESAAVRDSAADALGRIGSAAVASLRHLMSDEDPEVRWRATQAIRRTGVQAADVKTQLIERLRDKDARVRAEAVESTWSITQDAALVLPTVLHDLQDRDRRVRIRAYRFLIGLGPAADSALPRLKDLERDPRSEVRQAASRVIESIQSGKP